MQSSILDFVGRGSRSQGRKTTSQAAATTSRENRRRGPKIQYHATIASSTYGNRSHTQSSQPKTRLPVHRNNHTGSDEQGDSVDDDSDTNSNDMEHGGNGQALEQEKTKLEDDESMDVQEWQQRQRRGQATSSLSSDKVKPEAVKRVKKVVMASDESGEDNMQPEQEPVQVATQADDDGKDEDKDQSDETDELALGPRRRAAPIMSQPRRTTRSSNKPTMTIFDGIELNVRRSPPPPPPSTKTTTSTTPLTKQDIFSSDSEPSPPRKPLKRRNRTSRHRDISRSSHETSDHSTRKTPTKRFKRPDPDDSSLDDLAPDETEQDLLDEIAMDVPVVLPNRMRQRGVKSKFEVGLERMKRGSHSILPFAFVTDIG